MCQEVFVMGKLITLPFQFNLKEYYLLVQIRKEVGYEDFHVTTITDDLDAKLYVNYIFRWDGINHSIIKTPTEKLATRELSDEIWHTIYTSIILEKQQIKPDVQ
jgi:hypothetical protein